MRLYVDFGSIVLYLLASSLNSCSIMMLRFVDKFKEENNKRPLFLKRLDKWWFISAQTEMVFFYQNCSDLLREKIALVIEKNFWNSRLKAENLQNFWDN